MNEVGIKAIKDALGQAQDALYRAKLQKQHCPDLVYGNGVKIDDIVREYEKQLDDLSEALLEAEGKLPIPRG